MKIAFNPVSAYPLEEIEANQRRNRSLGFPRVGERSPVAAELAVVGGGPEVRSSLDELRSWGGEIWAINGTYHWLRENGIDSAFYAVDPGGSIGAFAKGAKRAIIADTVSRAVIDNLKGADVEVAFLGDGDLPHGTTAASTSVTVAAERGHKHVTFFGCGSSVGETTHAYRDEGVAGGRIVVECGGREYVSRADLIVQAEFISKIARAVPGFIFVRGGGFLPALIEHGDYDIVGVDSGTWKRLYEENEHIQEVVNG